MKRWLATIGSLLCVVLFGLAYYFTLAPPRRALIWTGSNVREHRIDFGLIPDFDYYLSAELDSTDFPAFANSLGLEPQIDDSAIQDVGANWGDCPESWWPTNLTLDNVYLRYEPQNDFYAVAKMHDGRVYYRAIEW